MYGHKLVIANELNKAQFKIVTENYENVIEKNWNQEIDELIVLEIINQHQSNHEEIEIINYQENVQLNDDSSIEEFRPDSLLFKKPRLMIKNSDSDTSCSRRSISLSQINDDQIIKIFKTHPYFFKTSKVEDILNLQNLPENELNGAKKYIYKTLLSIKNGSLKLSITTNEALTTHYIGFLFALTIDKFKTNFLKSKIVMGEGVVLNYEEEISGPCQNLDEIKNLKGRIDLVIKEIILEDESLKNKYIVITECKAAKNDEDLGLNQCLTAQKLAFEINGDKKPVFGILGNGNFFKLIKYGGDSDIIISNQIKFDINNILWYKEMEWVKDNLLIVDCIIKILSEYYNLI